MKFQLVLILILALTQADSIRRPSGSAFPKACAGHADCPADTICDYSLMTCAPRNCAFDNDCQSGSCRGGSCVVPGLNDEEGGSTNGPCTGNVDCKVDYKCNFATLLCQKQPIRCDNDGQCGQGNYCKAYGRVSIC